MGARCQYCGARRREERLGAELSPLKARIFDAVKRGRPTGASDRSTGDTGS
jgi:hypothetical protein